MISSMTFINDFHRRYAFLHFNYVISKFYHYIEFIKSSKNNETINISIQYLVFSKTYIEKLKNIIIIEILNCKVPQSSHFYSVHLKYHSLSIRYFLLQLRH